MKKSTLLFFLVLIAVMVCPVASIAGTVTLQWGASNGADGYYVYKNDARDTTATVTSTTGKVTVPPGKYKFNVTAYNSRGESPMSNSVYTPEVCTAPQNFAVSINGNAANFSWSAVDPATEYRLYVNGSQAQTIPTGTLKASIQLPTTGSTTAYLTAYNGWGESPASSTLTILPVPGAPSTLVIFSYAP